MTSSQSNSCSESSSDDDQDQHEHDDKTNQLIITEEIQSGAKALRMSSKNSHNQFMQLQGSHDHVAGEICLGRFTSVKNDFSLGADEIETMTTSSPHTEGQFRNDANWDCAKREKVKRFRFVVCTLSLMAIALSVMSRGMFNISIIEMTKDVSPVSHHQGQQQPNENELEPYNEIIDQTTKIPQVVHIIHPNEEDPANPTGNEIISVFTVDESDDENPEAGLHFSWSVKATNFLLSSFYFGYAPSMFLSGGIAEKYGSASLISICVLGSALINVFTPFMAAASYHALAASRILLGLLQGPLVPACYDIFNKWLTMTEMGAFVPLIKVSMAAGMIVGTMLPGFVTLSGHAWTYNFYIGGSICLVWLLVWSPLATSTPQSNSWMEESELQRIMRKKSAALSIIKLSNGEEQRESEKSSTAKELERATSIPWISIITSPSILVLTFVKFTYNLGMDFIFIESAIYLSQMHDASTETVSVDVMISALSLFSHLQKFSINQTNSHSRR